MADLPSEAEAQTQLALRLQPGSFPVLTADEVAVLVSIATSQGLPAAMRAGIGAKIAKASGSFDVKSASGAEAKQSQVLASLKSWLADWAPGGPEDPDASTPETKAMGITSVRIRRRW